MTPSRRGKLRTKVNSIYKQYVSDYSGRYLFYFGGAGSGKSIDMYYRIVKRICTEHDAQHVFLVLRKVAVSIKDSIWKGVIDMIKSMGLYEMFKINKVDRSIEYKVNGNVILMKGMDNSEKIKSLARVTSIFVEEVTEFEEKDWLQLMLRARGIYKYPTQLVAAFNPIDEHHWLAGYVEPQLHNMTDLDIKDFSFLNDAKTVWQFTTEQEIIDRFGFRKMVLLDTRVVNTTYRDNRFLDDQYIASLVRMSKLSANHYTVYSLGRWGRIQDGNTFVHKFDEGQHIVPIKYNPAIPLHYTVDFNVSPYMSGLVFQIEYISEGWWNGYSSYWDVRVIDEMALEHPRNDAQNLGAELSARYRTDAGAFLYGDASGNNRIGTREVKSLFADLKKGLGFIPVERIPRSNPKYAKIAEGSLGRNAFINLLFSGIKPLRIRIDPKCKQFIEDLRYCVQGKDGRMDKKKRDGHHLDAFTYLVCHQETFAYLAKY